MEISRSKKRAFNLLFGLLVVACVICIELLLRLSDAGFDTRPFVSPKYAPGILIDNPRFLDKYYGAARPRRNDEYVKNLFSAVKQPGVRRGFLVGESTAEGYPFHSNQSFGKMAEAALNDGGGSTRVEIINLGFSAMASYYVKDAALKCLDYDPDFIIIYAGHNEYYGTVSRSTGGNYYTKNLYLALREFRIFQLLSNLLSKRLPAGSGSDTLMSVQFSERRFPEDPAADAGVARDFIRNIDAVVRAYGARGIPVVVFEPVSNLADMPPFAGEHDDRHASSIRAYYRAVAARDVARMREFRRLADADPSRARNANIVYLNAKADAILTPGAGEEGFARARDLDVIPFRARNVLADSLRDYCASRAGKGVLYVSTSDELRGITGEGTPGGSVFIEHLHFNHFGHMAMGRILARALSRVLGFDAEREAHSSSFFDDRAKVDRAICFTPFDEISPYLSLRPLVESPPYSGMLVPFELPDYRKLFPSNEFTRVMERIRPGSHPALDAEISHSIIMYYRDRQDVENVSRYLHSFLFQAPGSPVRIHNLALFYSIMPRPAVDPLPLFLNAYLLSGKEREVYDDMKQYLSAQGMTGYLEEINRRYGKPAGTGN